ncbi:MAG: conjugal transfer protein, partial [Gammaproteobacteria bacterium]
FLTPKNLPAETDALETNTLGGGIRVMLEDASQINGPFLWSLNILFDEKVEQKIKTQASIMMMQRATGSFAVQVQKRNEEYTWALSQLSDKVRFVRIIPSVVVLGSSEQAVSVATSRARRLWEARGYEMQEETLMRRTLFLATLPLGLQTQLATLKVLDRDFPVPTLVAARLMPVQADFRGVDDNPVVPYVGRKGQAVGIDVFHPGSNNHNFLVCATSGSGKSFSMNHLLSNYYASGAKVRVVDLGYSYQKLCRAVSGRFLDYGERALVIIPFHSNANDEEDRKNDEIATLHVLAEMVYSSSDQKLTEIEWTLLKEAVRYAYETDPIQGIDAASRYLADFPRHASAEMKAFEDVSRLSARALAFNLSDFRSKGVYGHYFNGPSLFDIASDDFVVLELEKLKPKKELFRVIVLQVMNAITQDLYLSDRGNRRFILFEEAWAFFHAGN